MLGYQLSEQAKEDIGKTIGKRTKERERKAHFNFLAFTAKIQ